MNNIEYKIQTLLEKSDFDKLTPIEKEMVFSIMTEEEYTERRDLLMQCETLFAIEGSSIVPDAHILSDLKQRLQTEQIQAEEATKVLPIAWLSYKVPVVKSAAAMLLLLLGSYFFFAKANTKIEYVEKIVMVEKQVRDTIFQEKIVEVPIEKIIKVPVQRIVKQIEYRDIPVSKKIAKSNPNFPVNEQRTSVSTNSVELKDLNKSFGNTKINDADLEQFRVSL